MAGADTGGAETFFVDLVGALARAGLDQRAVIRRNERRAAALASVGIAVHELRFGRMFDFATRRGIATAAREFQPAIVQSWMTRATRHMPRGSFVRVGWLGGYYDPNGFADCDHVVGVTADIVRHLVDGGFAPSRAHHLPTFAAVGDAAPVPRASLATPADAQIILALGRLHEKKGFDVLLKALGQVPGAWLWLAGEGPLRADLEAIARQIGVAERVRFLGWRSDRDALLAACDVCVMPSRHEPFGTVMIEAWAARRPLIVAAAAGPKALVRPEIDAVLVPVDDAAALAVALQRVLGDRGLARRLAAEGRAAYEERFTEAVVVQQYLEFYRRIATGSVVAA